MIDLSRFILLLFVAGMVYLGTAIIIVSWLMRWRKGHATEGLCADGQHCPAPATTRPLWKRWGERSVVFLAMAGVGMLGWSFAEPYYPEIVPVTLHSPKLTAPVRIVQISDLHCDPKIRQEEHLPQIIAGLKPDLIAFTGDGINSEAGLPVFRACMQKLARIAPTFGVDGNWEAWWFADTDIFANTGVRELDGDAASLEVNGQTLWLAGTAVMHEERYRQALAQIPQNAFRLFLHHYPSMSREVAGKVDLHLAGDTHGGQIVLPVLGPLVRIKRFDRTFYPSGLHEIHGTWLYVNRGIGMEGGHVPRTRFLCRPEITVIDLLPQTEGRHTP